MRRLFTKPLRKKKGPLTLHGLTVGLGFPRALSSRIRKIYEERYKPKARQPRVVFLFDVGLIVVIAGLLVLIVSLILRPPLPITLDTTFSTPRVDAASPTPVSIRIRPNDGRTHRAVRVQWHLPSGTEVLSASPPILEDGTVFLGDLGPESDVASHLVIRTYHPAGEIVRFMYTVTNLEDGEKRAYAAMAERTIRSSAVSTHVPEAFQVDRVTPDGAMIPIAIRNSTDRAIPSVELRPTDESGVQFPRIVIGDLDPHETRYAFLPLGTLDRSPEVEWAVFAYAREIDRGSWRAGIAAWNEPEISEPLVSIPDEPTRVRIRGQNGTSLLIVRPFDGDPVREVQLSDDSREVVVTPSRADASSQQSWFVAPVYTDRKGRRLLGTATRGVFAGTLPFDVLARYWSASGDQLGIGPHPPEQGSETRYWVFWKIGSVDTDLRNIRVRTTLAPGVQATGNVSALSGGSWDIFGRTVQWRLPEISSQGVIPEALFGFEIRLVPENGGVQALIGESTAIAQDIRSDALLFSSKSAQSSENIPDFK